MLAGRRGAWLEVDLDALAHNFRVVHASAQGRPLWCVVKADAYGHGAVACARTLESVGAHGLVVALPEEGVALRRSGIHLPILLSGPLPVDGAQVLLEHNLTPTLSRLEDLQRLQSCAAKAGKTAAFHLELDSGMSRMGLPLDELDSFLLALRSASFCRLEAVLSHLASVSHPDDPAAQSQLERFQSSLAAVRSATAPDIPAHLASSPAICGFPAAACDMLRPGLLLYGITPAQGLQPLEGLEPVLSFRATVVLVRPIPKGKAVGYEGTWVSSTPTSLAVICAGYADGLLKDVSGKAGALHQGQLLPYVGAVNMDLAQLDAGSHPAIDPGDVVTLIGRDGDRQVLVEDLVSTTGRSAYEWLTSLGARVPRILLRDGRPEAVYTPADGPPAAC